MKVAFITRATLFNVPGGDTVQIIETAGYLRKLNAEVDIILSGKKINYSKYDLFHFFNITRPADILRYIKKIEAPVILSPILVDYSEYDRYHRKGLSGFIFKKFSPGVNEYIKTMVRAVKGNDSMPPASYILKGHKKSIKKILARVTILLPASELEYQKLQKEYGVKKEYVIVPNGISSGLFIPDEKREKEKNLVICGARIEGIKNQLNLIKALNDSRYNVFLIGSPAPNQLSYYSKCRKAASSNVEFIERLPQDELVDYYRRAKVHVLPSWFETCGLSSLEAAAMGCNIVITDKGYTKDYFGDDAFYCNPEDPASILTAVEKAASVTSNKILQKRILEEYTWENAAAITLEAYKKVVPG
ncbi:MAG: glycosyltransferase family 4 protein [Sphingobacteriales bacterium]|nr:glycosyltransferase family 4 protein [Sphingobacteriales bacterium]